jgi:two-component system phosphate regulon response regulator PhoB/two-component system alkaline phosphatase synthesis response regulator PhoP
MIDHGIPLDRIEEGRRRILVVDDDPYYLDIIPAALSRNGEYEIATASTGFDAGALVVQDNPQLIILDIHLSDTDGRMVCKRVKERPETKNTRILAISGYVDDDEARQLSNYGFDGYLKKPFGVAELAEQVRKLFEMPNSKIMRPRRSGMPAS